MARCFGRTASSVGFYSGRERFTIEHCWRGKCVGGRGGLLFCKNMFKSSCCETLHGLITMVLMRSSASSRERCVAKIVIVSVLRERYFQPPTRRPRFHRAARDTTGVKTMFGAWFSALRRLIVKPVPVVCFSREPACVNIASTMVQRLRNTVSVLEKGRSAVHRRDAYP